MERKRTGIISILFLGITLLLTGCGGGGGGGTTPAPSPTPPASSSASGYTVSGAAIGLSGPLALQNDAGDDLTITTDGTSVFTFNTPLVDSSAYSVTIKTLPVLQNCTISNGSGTISSADVINVSVTCANRTWTNPSLTDSISPNGSITSNGSPQVAMDDKGNAVIVWAQYDGSNSQIFKSDYRNGKWTNPAKTADNISPDGPYAQNPQVAMDDKGNAVIVWAQKDATVGGYYQIFKSEYRNGTWTNPSSLSDNISPDGTSAYSPQVAMDNNGNAIIVWKQYGGTKNQIFKSDYRNGTWTNPSSLADNISLSTGGTTSPQVAMDDKGNAIITWVQYDGTHNHIFKSDYRNGKWTKPLITGSISPSVTDITSSPQVAMDNNGNAIITWAQSDGTNTQIFKSEYRNGTWTNPSLLTDNISPDGMDAQNPQVAMDNNSNAIITWAQYKGSNTQIFKSEYRNGKWTNPAKTADNISPEGTSVDNPQVAMDNHGNAVITWAQYNGARNQIFKSEYRNGKWTKPLITGSISPSGQDAYHPQIAMDHNGDAVITWNQFDGTYERAFKSVYR